MTLYYLKACTKAAMHLCARESDQLLGDHTIRQEEEIGGDQRLAHHYSGMQGSITGVVCAGDNGVGND